MSKYVEELDGGFVRILGGAVTFKKSFFKDMPFLEFKERYAGKLDKDIVKTYELLTGKKATTKKPSPRKKRSASK